MNKLGLKVWSINENYAKIVEDVYNQEQFDFIELYALPDTYNETINYWTPLKKNITFKIHAPHFMHGVNFSNKDNYNNNFKLIKDSFKFADSLDTDTIIFHPGIAGDYKESAIQMSQINDSRAFVENKPYKLETTKTSLLKETDKSVGAKFSELAYILENTSLKFCLDIGHSVATSNALNLDVYEELNRFNSLNPQHYHLSDGDIKSDIDLHYNIGEGNYDYNKLFEIINDNIPITIESNKNSNENLDDFIDDLRKLKPFLNSK